MLSEHDETLRSERGWLEERAAALARADAMLEQAFGALTATTSKPSL